MRQTTKARHTLGIRGQLMWFLCFICLFLLGLFWLLSTQLLEPLYTKHIETQLTNQADSIVERLDDAIAEGKVLSSWSFGQLAVNSDFFDKLTLELYTKGSLNSFCVDISDTTLHTIYKIENQSFCNLHGTYLSDSANNDKIIATALAMRRKCRSVGSFVQTLNPPRLSGSAQLLVGRITADGSYTVLVTTSLVHVTEAGKVLSTLLPLAAALIFGFAMSAAWLFSEWFTKPLRQLSSAARQMALGNYAVQVDNRRNDELGDLARDFNHMAEEVQHAVQMQRDLLANVSHDLRTPLTLIKGYAETVRDLTGDDKAHRDEQMNIIVDEADRLTALVSSVMELSKVTSGADKCERVHFDMGQLCDEVSERYDAICAQNGWPTFSVETYKHFVGNGIPKLVERFSPESARTPEQLAATLAAFSARYDAHKEDKTAPYPGMAELLDALQAEGIQTAVFSNKADEFCGKIVEHYFGKGKFTVIRGSRKGVPTKPDPAGVYALMQDIGADPKTTLFIGDSDVDILTGHNAHLPAMGVLWGFRGEAELTAVGADALARTPEDILDYLHKANR